MKDDELIAEARLDAKAFRENTVYDSEGDPIRLIANAERLELYADALTTLSAENERLRAAAWRVLAYDQLLRKVGEIRAEALLAGDMPNVDAAYDDMVKTCVNALSGKTGGYNG